MATNIEENLTRRVSGGRVFERAFSTIRHNPGPTLGLAFLFGAVPGVLATYLTQAIQPEMIEQQGFGIGFYAILLFSVVLGLIINAIVSGALTRATVAESEGRKASFGESAGAGLAVLLPLIGMSILLAIGVAFGFMLLIVPGIILYCMWSVAVPALVEERRGVFASFGRSKDLTDGAKWKVFGILLVVMMVYWLSSAVVGMYMLSSVDISNPQAPFQMPMGVLISNLLMGTLINLFWGLVQASLYVELRDWKDGPAIASLEQVFS